MSGAADWNVRIGATIVSALVGAAVGAPLLAPYDPLAIGPATLQSPSHAHLLGTDRLGRDVLSRLLFGARLSLLAAFVATVLIMAIGITVGTVAGYFGGFLDTALMRYVDGLLALPSLVFVLAIAGFFAPSLLTLIEILAAVSWGGYARLVRGLVLTARESEFVVASRAIGAGSGRIILRHVLPAVLSHVVVLASLELGYVILAISGLSFLGLGAQPPTPEWGAMVNEGRTFFASSPHVLVAAGACIWLAVLGCNLLGDGLRDALDPASLAAVGHRRGGTGRALWRRVPYQ